MAMIPSEEVNLIRKEADIVDVIGSYINLVPKGKNYFGVCPFHNDHSPSLSVSPDKQIYRCFTCSASGNVFTFVQNYENISFVEAVKKVADKIGHHLDVDTKQTRINHKYYEMMDLSNKIFINNMNSSLGKEAKDYLINERKLTEDIIKEFNIGLALKDNKLNKVLTSKGYSEKEILDMSLGVKSDNELIDMFRNRITFPITSDKGEIIAYSARIFHNEDASKYINSKESIIFKKGSIFYNYDKCRLEALKTKTVIIVEGQMDAIRVYSSGIKNVVATMGTALTSEHIKFPESDCFPGIILLALKILHRCFKHTDIVIAGDILVKTAANTLAVAHLAEHSAIRRGNALNGEQGAVGVESGIHGGLAA